MKLGSKLGLAVLAGALAMPLAFAQGPTPAPGTDDQGGAQGNGPGGAPPQGRRMGPGGPGGQGGPGGWRGQGGGQDGKRGWGGGGGHRRGMRGRGRGRGGEFSLARLVQNPAMREKLGITAEQADKIQRQTSDFQKAQIRSRADMQVKRLELRDLMRGDAPDRAAIDKKIDEIGAARLTQSKAETHYRLDMRASLTPEQRQKLREMMQQGRGRGGQGGGRPGGPGGPPRGPRGSGTDDE